MSIDNLPIFEHIQKFKENCIRLQKANKLNPATFKGRVQTGYLMLVKDTLNTFNMIKHDLIRYTIDNISIQQLNDVLDIYYDSGKWRDFEIQIHNPFKAGNIEHCYELLTSHRNDVFKIAEHYGATLNTELDNKIKARFEVQNVSE